MSHAFSWSGADEARRLEILEEVKRLAVEYHAITGKPLGVTGEIAEFEAAKHLRLTLVDARTPAFDALRDGKRIQIKGRVFSRERCPGQRMGHIKNVGGCDAVVLVLLDPGTMDAWGIWEASAEVAGPLQVRSGARGIPVTRFVKAPGVRQVWPADLAATEV